MKFIKTNKIINIITLALLGVFTFVITGLLLKEYGYFEEAGGSHSDFVQGTPIRIVGYDMMAFQGLFIYTAAIITCIVLTLLLLLKNCSVIKNDRMFGYKLKTNICMSAISVITMYMYALTVYVRFTTIEQYMSYIDGVFLLEYNEQAYIYLVEWLLIVSLLIIFLIISGKTIKKLQIVFLVIQSLFLIVSLFFIIVGLVSPMSWAIIFVWVIGLGFGIYSIGFSIANTVISIINYIKTKQVFSLILFIISIIFIVINIISIIVLFIKMII